mmetsp:Transcript_32797/g.76559  ORF Transcript_32797/g.76559 Transcript_32797/m.76559 type:complete len:265 (-) Transcript_32797:2088-2882(-)
MVEEGDGRHQRAAECQHRVQPPILVCGAHAHPLPARAIPVPPAPFGRALRPAWRVHAAGTTDRHHLAVAVEVGVGAKGGVAGPRLEPFKEAEVHRIVGASRRVRVCRRHLDDSVLADALEYERLERIGSVPIGTPPPLRLGRHAARHVGAPRLEHARGRPHTREQLRVDHCGGVLVCRPVARLVRVRREVGKRVEQLKALELQRHLVLHAHVVKVLVCLWDEHARQPTHDVRHVPGAAARGAYGARCSSLKRVGHEEQADCRHA